jgi:hypothetical protein
MPFFALTSREHGFLLKGGFPGLDVLIGEAFGASSDRFDCQFVEYGENACSDPVADTREMTQTLAR